MNKRLIGLLILFLSLFGCSTVDAFDQPKITEEYAWTLTDSQLHDGIGGQGDFATRKYRNAKGRVAHGLALEEKLIFKNELIQRNPEWQWRVKDEIKNGSVIAGMNEAHALASCGSPHHITRSFTTSHVIDQWVYGSGDNQRSFYVDNGVVTTAVKC